MSARSQCHLWPYEGGFLNLVPFARWSRAAETVIYFRVVNNLNNRMQHFNFAEKDRLLLSCNDKTKCMFISRRQNAGQSQREDD